MGVVIGAPYRPDIRAYTGSQPKQNQTHLDICTRMSPSICRVVEDAKYQTREKRAARRAKKQPWIVLKLMVFITAGIMIYTAYVYIGRFCVPGIRREHAFVTRGASSTFYFIYYLLILTVCSRDAGGILPVVPLDAVGVRHGALWMSDFIEFDRIAGL